MFIHNNKEMCFALTKLESDNNEVLTHKINGAAVYRPPVIFISDNNSWDKTLRWYLQKKKDGYGDVIVKISIPSEYISHLSNDIYKNGKEYRRKPIINLVYQSQIIR